MPEISERSTVDGLCQCGCGEKAPLAKWTERTKGKVKGQPQRFINGHQRRDPLFHRGLKRCSRCDEVKPLGDFRTRRKGASVESRCRSCEVDTQRESRSSDGGKSNARGVLNQAISRGKVSRPDSCERCGKKCLPDGHHHDYTKPYDVEWLCRPCHRAHHAAIQMAEAEATR